jgi:outer membrane receptor protein involved in Fe transport
MKSMHKSLKFGFMVWVSLLNIRSGFSQPVPVKDTLSGEYADEVVITGSHMRELLLAAPTSVQKATSLYFQNNSAPSFFDALQNLKGVQMITPSMGFRILNTRGFANTTNVRFAQLVDGMDVQSPHIGSPIGNALGPGDLDIDRVEIVPGVAASLYGMNAINGLANFASKNPFDYQGISVQQKVALTHINSTAGKANLFSETSIRFAKAWKNKWAIKANFAYISGYDWIADDYTDMNPNANQSTGLTGEDNPAKDPVNSYGNESSNRRTLTLGGKSYVVARTGYTETQVTSYDLRNVKGDLTLMYKPNERSSIAYIFRGAGLDNVYQRANRFRLDDYFIQQHALQYRSGAVQANVYLNGENTGQSYNLRSMAENIDRSFKNDNTWFADYSGKFNQASLNGIPSVDAHRQAREFADNGRLEPGSSAFNSTLDKLRDINNWDSGAALRVKASFVQADVQWNLGESLLEGFTKKTGVELMAGADHRTYIIQPDGNYFINPGSDKQEKNLLYGKTGAFISTYRNFFGKKLRLGAALRGDKNDYFPLYVSPRFTAVYNLNEKHYLRTSYQVGYRFPIVFEGFSNVNSGGVKRVGGLPVMSNGIFENAWLQTSIASFQSAVLRDMNTSALTRNQAIEKNKSILQKNPYTYLEPEQVKSLELGYRAMLFDKLLFVDADVYYNSYNKFIAQANMNVPNTGVADSIPYDLYDRTKQAPYRMWTNSSSKVYNYGFSIGLNLRFPKGYQLTTNTSYAKLKRGDTRDGLEDGFNTPAWMINTTFANNKIGKNFGAGITYRWQSSFYWQSFLVNGTVPSYGTVDVHATYSFGKLPLQVKSGANNLLNTYYNSFLGGPSVGGFYYMSLTFSGLMAKKGEG